MPKEVTNTTVTFTYDAPDALHETTRDNNVQGQAEYNGPDRIWVFIDNDNGKIARIAPPLTAREDGDEVPTPPGHTKVEVVAADEPVIISLIMGGNVETTNQVQTTETLPDGNTITYDTIAPLCDCYDLDELIYDVNTNTWTLPSFLTHNRTWNDVIETRNTMLASSDSKIAPDQPEAMKTAWTEYRQALRDLPATFGYGTDSEIAAWKVQYPQMPGEN